MSSETYVVKRAIREVETRLLVVGRTLPTRTSSPLSQGYRPETDRTPILRWICELGRIDILMPLSMMSRYLVCSRAGHLDQLFHIFAYLKHHARSTLVFDPSEPTFDEEVFKCSDWSEFYPEATEAITIEPTTAPAVTTEPPAAATPDPTMEPPTSEPTLSPAPSAADTPESTDPTSSASVLATGFAMIGSLVTPILLL